MHGTRTPNSHTYAAEQESLLSHPPQAHYALPPNHPPRPLFLSRRFAARRDRRALSLELPELLRAGRQPGGLAEPGRRTGSGAGASVHGGSVSGSGLGGDHRDCNGKAPGPHTCLITEVFPQVNARKDRADLEEETDYVSGTVGSRPDTPLRSGRHLCLFFLPEFVLPHAEDDGGVQAGLV